MINTKTLEIFNLFTDYNGSVHISAGTLTVDFEIILNDVAEVFTDNVSIMVIDETIKVIRKGDATDVIFSVIDERHRIYNYRLSFYKAY